MSNRTPPRSWGSKKQTVRACSWIDFEGRFSCISRYLLPKKFKLNFFRNFGRCYLNLYLRLYLPGSIRQNSVAKLRYQKTDGSSVFLKGFWRTVFGHFPLSRSKKFWNSKFEFLTGANTDIFISKNPKYISTGVSWACAGLGWSPNQLEHSMSWISSTGARSAPAGYQGA